MYQLCSSLTNLLCPVSHLDTLVTPRRASRLSLALICLAWVGATSCGKTRASADANAPECRAACVLDADKASVVELDGATLRVWAAGVDDRPALEASHAQQALAELERLDDLVAKRLGMRRPQIIHFICPAEVPVGALFEILDDPQAARFATIALAGRPEGAREASFAPAAIWSQRRARQDVEAGQAVFYKPEAGALKPCKTSLAAACPTLLIDPAEHTCGELLNILDKGVPMNRLFGLVKPASAPSSP